MTISNKKILIMAGGTGGHIFPALAVANILKEKGYEVSWLGTANSMESKLVPKHKIPFTGIPIKGLRGNGWLGWVLLPFRLMRAVRLAKTAIKKENVDLVIGFGGFASGPGGLAAKQLKKPLFIHEQNAIFGMTNKTLSRFAKITFSAFEHTKPETIKTQVIGNPLRKEIIALHQEKKNFDSNRPLHLLVLGGSQGALALNQLVPQALNQIPAGKLSIKHQAGQRTLETAQLAYANSEHPVEITPFIDDMAEAYRWADLIICRSGALTVCEVACAGVPAIFIPHPHVVDDHQRANAQWLSQQGAAICTNAGTLTANTLAHQIEQLMNDREHLQAMSKKAQSLSKVKAAEDVVTAVQSYF